jgi:pyruvate formate lyase activating enzyme
VSVCHSGARAFGSKFWTPEQVLEKVLPEKIFFDTSDGGVTFSGGECMTHGTFMAETLKLLKEHDIHTTVDTCGAAPTKNFEAVLPYADLFLYDLKKMNPMLHKAYTGMDNELILKNLELLCDNGANIIIRIPLIPGYTDGAENLEAIRRFVGDCPWEQLPYNELAGAKYPMMNRIYPLDNKEGE